MESDAGEATEDEARPVLSPPPPAPTASRGPVTAQPGVPRGMEAYFKLASFVRASGPAVASGSTLPEGLQVTLSSIFMPLLCLTCCS